MPEHCHANKLYESDTEQVVMSSVEGEFDQKVRVKVLGSHSKNELRRAY